MDSNSKGTEMLKHFKGVAKKTKDAFASAATAVGDLNGDGRVDELDLKIAAERLRKVASSASDEAGRLGREVARSDLAKDAATGAAIGAVVAVPVPVVGPVAGAVIGAGIGMYKNVTKKQAVATERRSVDHYGELLKLDDLRSKGILSEEEFSEEKRRLLKDRNT
jgi:hypothetical protein